ncbi:sigma-70 family RNA polymerase sigma factor [Streptomyces sp. NPDC053499]|uniref:sigma-70 family RNA polymerase sigma factor n=1 Tax=Streptomyces sp. NPDC053499 TaxID=3365707 RepID=UPI0037CDF1F0
MAADDTMSTPPPGPSTATVPETLSEEQAERMFAEMNEIIRAGEETRRLRTEMIRLLARSGWSQEKIARLAGMSQPAVSKQVTKYKADRSVDVPPSLVDLSLDQNDTPWLEGRLWGLAEEISAACPDSARCTRFLHAVARGRKRFTPQTVDELRRLVEHDLLRHRAELSGGYRAAYDRISRGLDVPSPVPAPASSPPPSPGLVPAPGQQGTAATAPAPASVRRALARQVQRDHLRHSG